MGLLRGVEDVVIGLLMSDVFGLFLKANSLGGVKLLHSRVLTFGCEKRKIREIIVALQFPIKIPDHSRSVVKAGFGNFFLGLFYKSVLSVGGSSLAGRISIFVSASGEIGGGYITPCT